MSTGRRSAENSGIQANNVTADVLAVGTGARAVKTVHAGADAAQLQRLIAELRNGFSQLSLQPQAHAALAEDIASLDQAAKDAAQNKPVRPESVSPILSSIVGKLKMVGVVLGDVAALAEPVKKIVGLLGIPLPW
jgi:hypothetical protein